ncbi:MAG: carbohydrate ABC transporter permease [Ruminococcus sp.]
MNQHTSAFRIHFKGWTWIFPSLLGVTVLFLLPFGIVIYYSLISNAAEGKFAGLNNYTDLLQNEAFLLAVRNTLFFTLTAIPLSMISALFFAFLIEHNIPGKSVIRTFFLTPVMVPAASVVIVWQALFDDKGCINSALERFGAEPVQWLSSEYGMAVLILIFIWKTMGYNMVLMTAGLSGIPADYLETARIEGASAVWQFFHIKLRYLFPTLFFVLLYDIICSFRIFREVYLLTGDYPCRELYLLQHFMNNTFESASYQKLSSAAVLLALAMLIVTGILFFAEQKIGKELEE